MASHPNAPKVESAVVAEVLLLSVTDIDPAPDSRIGLYYPEKAEGLAARIQCDGQNDPIKVRRNGNRAKFPYTLVAGLHRLEACRLNGWKVRAIAVEGNAAELASIQASENIDRRELAPIERAMFVAAVADAAKARLRALNGGKSQQQAAIETRWQGHDIRGDKMSSRIGPQFSPLEKADTEAEIAAHDLMQTYRWAETTAEACGLGVRDLKRSLRIYRVVVEPNRDLMDAFKSHPVASNASGLETICAKGGNPANVRAIIEWLIANPGAKSADEALAALELAPAKGVQSEPSLQRFSATIRIVGKMAQPEVMGLFASPVFQDMLPKEIRDLLAPIRKDGGAPA